MSELNIESGSSDGQQKGNRRRADRLTRSTSPGSGSGSGFGSTNGVPCGACKFLRRRCVNECIFAPHFSPDQGIPQFAGVHKVFGASNVSKLLTYLPVHHRQHAAETILYEAQARLADPVYGCVSVIIGLQQQIAALQMELAMVQNKLIKKSLMEAHTLQQPKPVHHHDPQPMYSTGSSSDYSQNIFDSSLHNPAHDHPNASQSQRIYYPLQVSQLYRENKDDDEDESGTL